MRSAISICGATAALVLVAGCTPLSDVTVKTPVEPRLGRYSAALLDVTVDSESVERAIPAERSKLDNLTLVGLRTARVFNQTHRASEVPEDAGNLRIDVRIIECYEVPSWKLTVFGLFGGRHRMTANVTLTEIPSGRAVGDITVSGSSAMGNVYSGGIDQAIEACAETFIGYMKVHR